MGDIRNCKQCGKLFNYTGKSLCPECLKSKEDEFNEVKEYIRENPSAGIADVSEATGTSVNQIRQWVREERLAFSDVTAGGGINCESCGRPIKTGRLCASCKNQVSRDLTQAFLGNRPETSGADGMSAKKGDRMRYLSKD